MLLAAILFPATLSQAAVTLKYMPPVGKAIRYRMVMNMKQEMGPMGASSFTTSVEMSIKALSRSGDVTTVETTGKNAKVTMPPGSPAAGMKDAMEKQMSSMKTTSKMNSHYGVVGSDTAIMASLSGGPGSATTGLTFPDHPVKVGDTWKASLDFGKIGKAIGGKMGVSGMSMSGVIPIKMKLLSISGGKASIAMDMTGTLVMGMPAGAGPKSISTKMSSKGTFVCNLSDGTVVSSSMTSDSTTPMGNSSMKQHMTNSMTRL